jgi:hypothetical protein
MHLSQATSVSSVVPDSLPGMGRQEAVVDVAISPTSPSPEQFSELVLSWGVKVCLVEVGKVLLSKMLFLP